MFWAISLLTIPVAYITKKVIENLPTKIIKEYSAYYGWYVLEFFSRVEIKAQNTYASYISPYLPVLNNEEEKQTLVTLIKDGKKTHQFELSEFKEFIETDNISEESYDFIIYEAPINDNEKYDKYFLRFRHHLDIMKVEYCKIQSAFSFNSIQLKISDKTYTLNFNKNQFLIRDNILFDRNFVKWFMNKYHDVLIADDAQYNINIIDHQMNFISLTEDNYILIKRDSYEIAITEEI